MSEFIDRVAHAIEQAMVNASPDNSQCSRDMSLILARAAIEAMEQPSQKMIEAGNAVDDGDFGSTAYEHWRVMIIAELKPE